MRCTRAAVYNQTFKSCGHGCENTNEYRKKRSNRVWEVEKTSEGGHVNPHRVTWDLAESQSNFTLQVRLV